jgi:hypothetical protein
MIFRPGDPSTLARKNSIALSIKALISIMLLDKIVSHFMATNHEPIEVAFLTVI